ncbi:MAG: hypothetical protein PHQ23_10775, partial [Candidatus Wallbacteria bacterium]|nr:hypothetical protein [Candidatus Wallbacteria bacterium]
MKALINTSLWTLHLSKILSDESAKDAAEQVYAASLDENERQSAMIAEAIVDQILASNIGTGERPFAPSPITNHPSPITPSPCSGIDICSSLMLTQLSTHYPLFDLFEDTFNSATNNEKNGLGILAGKIEELLLQSNIRRQQGNYLSRIKKIIAQSQNAQVSFTEWQSPFSELVEKYGLLCAQFHGTALDELTVTNDLAEYRKKKKLFEMAFDIYEYLNRSLSDKQGTASEIYDQARAAYTKAEYASSAGLFLETIDIDSSFGSHNGCRFWSGFSRKKQPQPDQAVKQLLESVKSDGTEAYRLSAYHAGRSVFLEDKAADEQTYLAEIKYLEGVYASSNTPEVKATALYDMGSVYRWKLGPLTSLSRDQRIDYYKKGGAVYRRCADEFPQWKTADRVLEFSAGCYGGGEIHRLLAERKDEREECYLLAIDAYDKLRSLYPQSLSYEYALSDTAYLYSQIGFMTYLDEHNHSVTLQYKREFLTLSIETHRQYLKE